MMLGDTSGPWNGAGVRRGSKPELWSNICKFTCAFQMVGGVFLAFLSTTYLFDYMMTTGVIIGGLLFIIGAIGLVGSFKQNKDFLNFHIVGAILTIVLSFQFAGQVHNPCYDTKAKCCGCTLVVLSSTTYHSPQHTEANRFWCPQALPLFGCAHLAMLLIAEGMHDA
ncbi:unnamed protein product [Ostreobium quekettii]|uniref:Uncharacterized protein n=1 Tax=Ostreobium quekettii TaxID=121088 RepID=A0A8S1J6Z5_9CHLO|nr:unnamed protein product [Ostreobium quekettii]